MDASVAGKLLVATPELIDPNFARTVVLILEHDPLEGAFGLVLNRPTTIDPSPQLPAWAPFMVPATVYIGGPVANEMAIGLGDTPGTPPEDWRALTGNTGVIDLGTDPESLGGVLRARVWAGYSGWTAGQLEDELETRSWFVVDADPGDVFTETPASLWRDVLRRQDSRLSWYADFPTDLHDN
jgi:putative transcriptional regulator